MGQTLLYLLTLTPGSIITSMNYCQETTGISHSCYHPTPIFLAQSFLPHSKKEYCQQGNNSRAVGQLVLVQWILGAGTEWLR